MVLHAGDGHAGRLSTERIRVAVRRTPSGSNRIPTGKLVKTSSWRRGWDLHSRHGQWRPPAPVGPPVRVDWPVSVIRRRCRIPDVFGCLVNRQTVAMRVH